MKMWLASAVTLLALAPSALADVRQVAAPDLKSIEASGPYRIEIVGGPSHSAVLEGTPAHLARIKTEYENGALRVSDTCRFNCSRRHLEVVLRVVTPQLESLDVSKGIEAKARDLVAGDLKLVVEMGATLDIAGRCESLSVRARMGADLDASGLVCRQVDISASMGADADVHATESIRANGSMGADVRIHGNPTRRDVSGAMGASISSP
jgi:hypothetical protein